MVSPHAYLSPLPYDMLLDDTNKGSSVASPNVYAKALFWNILYDGSARPSTVTTYGLLSTDTSIKGGTGSAIVLAKEQFRNHYSIVKSKRK